MAKSAEEFLRLKTLLDRGYDPLSYRFFCLGGHYRTRLKFTWESLDGAATALNRLRVAVHGWGAAKEIHQDYAAVFAAQVNDDLNMPRALATAWELVGSDLPPETKKATLLHFDKVLGLGLGEWKPIEEDVPDEIMALAHQRQQARAAKRWEEADILRQQIIDAGYEVEDTLQGPRLRTRK